MVKRYRRNLKSDLNPLSTWIRGLSEAVNDETVTTLSSALTSEGGKVLQEIFHGVPFNYSKPPSLIGSLIKQIVPKNGLVLDSFAGSGTTAHAVLALNGIDGGDRRFVIIENQDFADSLTAERVRRVIKGVPKAKDAALRKGLGGSFSFIEVGNPMGLGSLLKGDKLPSFTDLAGYVFYTASGEEFDGRAVNKRTSFIGTSARYDVYLFYEPDLEYLKNTALTLDMARGLPKGSGKRRLVFAPTKYLDSIHLEENRIDFCQLPFEIYKAVKPKKA